MKVAKKANLGVLVLVFTLLGAVILVFTPALVTPVQARTVRTFQYTGNGGTTQVASGMAVIRSLRIVTVPQHGQASQAYTTYTIQQGSPGTFLNGNRRDTGISLEAGNFTVIHPEFNEIGVVYHWEAHGD